MFTGHIELQGPFGPVKAVEGHRSVLEKVFADLDGCSVALHSSVHEKSGEMIDRRLIIECVGFVKSGTNLGATKSGVISFLRRAAKAGFMLAYDGQYLAFGRSHSGTELCKEFTRAGLAPFTALICKPYSKAKKAFGF